MKMFNKFSKTLFTLCLFLIVVNSFELESRIIDGLTAQDGQFPFYAYLKIRTKTQRIACGGSLISDQWVLTAAHCVKDATSVKVTLGMQERFNSAEGIAVDTVSKANIFVYRMFVKLLAWNDIALIKLTKPVSFTKTIQPIHFAPECQRNKNINVVAMGFGWTNMTSKKQSSTLQHATLRTIPCNEYLDTLGFFIFRTSILCAKSYKKQSICNGDSGSPLIRKSDNTLVGIVSFGIKGNNADYPQVFTSVHSYHKWISSVTGIQLPSC